MEQVDLKDKGNKPSFSQIDILQNDERKRIGLFSNPSSNRVFTALESQVSDCLLTSGLRVRISRGFFFTILPQSHQAPELKPGHFL